MYKDFIFWATEYLNYFSLIFWGIKLFLKKYDVKTGRKEWVENVIIIVASAPVVWLCADNYRFVIYSNFMSHLMLGYIYLFVKCYSKGKAKRAFSLVAIYVHGMRLIDLLVVAVIYEVNGISRDVKLNIVCMGFQRSLFLVFLSAGYYIVYIWLRKSLFVECLYDNMLYRWIMCIYSFFGIMCFCRVYRFEYTEHLIQYWIFYLVCAFVLCGVFIFYFVQVKSEEKNRILSMRNDLLESNYQSLQKAYDENRMLYHDFKNHMLAISQLIKEDRNEEALEYVSTYINWTLSIDRRVETGCKIIDIIVNCKITEATEKEINFTYDIDVIGKINIQDIDMCALLANLLDNAIEACEKNKGEKKWIYLKIRKRNHMLFIWLENSISKRKKNKINFFQSMKDNKELHGLGMKSIDNVIQKYDGYKEYKVQENQFQIYISLPVK